MNIMKRPVRLVMIAAFVFVFACVTINIYFPAEKVQSVAGEIVSDIRGKDQPAKPALDKKSQGALSPGVFFALGAAAAWADDVTAVSNPTIRALKASMKQRFAAMKPYYDQGRLVEGNDGYVALGNTGGLDLKTKRDLNALVDAENADRKRLYAAVASALNIEASQVGRVAQIFAGQWQKSIR